MTHLSKRTQYGLRAAVQLARRWEGGYVQSRDLSAEEELPTKFLEQVLLLLRRGGLLESKVGSGGGYRLKRPPAQIGVAELIRVLGVEPDIDQPPHPTLGYAAIQILQERMAEAETRAMEGLTLADLADEAARRGNTTSAMYYI